MTESYMADEGFKLPRDKLGAIVGDDARRLARMFFERLLQHELDVVALHLRPDIMMNDEA